MSAPPARLVRLLLLALFVDVLIAGFAAADERPNILLILTDDQGWATLGCYGGKRVATPHLDRLAANGARFTDAYVTSQCTPTRATLLTGQYTARHGLWHVLPWYGYPHARMTEPPYLENYSRDTFTIAKGLRDAGYATAIVGKWHLTANQDGHYLGLRPQASHFYGFDHAPPVITRDAFAPGADRGVERFTTEALQFIKANKDRPWFCYLSHHMIHGVVVAPEEITQKYRELGYGDVGPNRAVYLAGLECIDRSIGRLMRELEAMGEAENTVVIFLSDNGGVDWKLDFKQLPGHEHPKPFPIDAVEYNNAPLRAGKGSIYEGGVRVPMIVHWPKRVSRGSVISAPVHAIDILPTCFALAKASAPDSHQLDGVDLSPTLINGVSTELNDRAIFQYYPFYDLRWGLTPSASVRQGDYKLIVHYGDRVDASHQYRTGRRVELYNLRDDLGESHNLATAEPERAARMQETLATWRQSVAGAAPKVNRRHDAARAFFETREKPEWLRELRWRPKP